MGMKILGIAVFVVAAAVIVMGAFIRFSPMDGRRWHVDPLVAERPTTPNYVMMRDDDGDLPALILPGTVVDVARRLDEIAMSEDYTMHLAGRPQDGLVTYVQRTPYMRYPDAISIRIEQADEGHVRISMFSRARFGRSDFGVNLQRVQRWSDALRAGS